MIPEIGMNYLENTNFLLSLEEKSFTKFYDVYAFTFKLIARECQNSIFVRSIIDCADLVLDKLYAQFEMIMWNFLKTSIS